MDLDPLTTTRRDLLLAGGVLAAGALVPARGLAASAAKRPSYASLGASLKGTLSLPGQRGFTAAAREWNPYAQQTPRAVAFCATPGDVAKVLHFASVRGYALAPRSGRHSFAGYSAARGTVVADVSKLHSVVVDRAAGTVRVGAGATVQQVYEEVTLRQGVAVAHGTCPTVGMAGLTLGGGISRMVRRIGMTCDQLVSAQVVLPGGRIVTADATHEPDLFWALRGGGGGNFGVVTSMTLRTQPAPDLLTLSMSWDWANATAAFDAWQRTFPQATRDLGVSTFRALRTPDGTLSTTVGGHWYGSEADLRAMLAPLAATSPKTLGIAKRTWAAANEPDGCDAVPGGSALSCTVDRYPNLQRSAFIDEPIAAGQIATMLGFVERWPGGPGGHEGGLQFEALGAPSAVNAVSPSSTAYVHRSSLMHVVYLNFWGAPDQAAANVAWVRDFYTAMSPSQSGSAYQNYIDPGLADWRSAYYGANLARLQRVRKHYDPTRLLRFAQGL